MSHPGLFARWIFSVGVLLYAFVEAFGVIRIVGKLPERPQLFEKLCSLPPSDSVPSFQSEEEKEFYEVHRKWIDKILEFIEKPWYMKWGERKGEISPGEAASYFDPKDARQILRPLLKRVHHFDLTEETIGQVFRHNVPYDIERHTRLEERLNFFRRLDTKERLYALARKVVDVVKGEMLIVIGQTPAYLGCMVEAINEQLDSQNKITIVPLPMSGKPDSVFYKPLHGYANIVTRDRDKFIRREMHRRRFSPYWLQSSSRIRKVYLLDNTMGPSMACFLLLVARWFRDEGLGLPDMWLLNLHDQPPFDMKVNENLSFDIDTIVLGADEDIAFNFDLVPDSLRVQPQFSAKYWSEEFRRYFEEYPRPKAKELLKEYAEFASKKYALETRGSSCFSGVPPQ